MGMSSKVLLYVTSSSIHTTIVAVFYDVVYDVCGLRCLVYAIRLAVSRASAHVGMCTHYTHVLQHWKERGFKDLEPILPKGGFMLPAVHLFCCEVRLVLVLLAPMWVLGYYLLRSD